METSRLSDALGHAPADKRIEILRGIARSGSISQAAREAGVSYKAAWQAIDTLTNLTGVALVERVVGGAGGGGALLTVQGHELLALAEAHDAARTAVQRRWQTRQGGAGSAAARLALRTSMRNQLLAHILRLDVCDNLVRVRMRIGESGVITAKITRESAELLGLCEAMEVVVLCKATAVRVDRPGRLRGAKTNLFAAAVSSVTRGGGGDEIALALAPDLRLAGFAPAGSMLRARQRVEARVDESAVVIALPG